jgi:hypothetical protein
MTVVNDEKKIIVVIAFEANALTEKRQEEYNRKDNGYVRCLLIG